MITKIGIIATALMSAGLLLSACNYYETDVSPDDGFGGYTDEQDILTEYMLGIADNLITRSLDELEQVLTVDPTSGTARYFYETGGKALTEPDSKWVILREGEFHGMTISYVQENTWELSLDGNLTLMGYSFPTQFTLTAAYAYPEETGSHRGWMVQLRGNREETDGMTCSFFTDESLEYRAFAEDPFWGAYGYLLMDVFQDEERIDRVVMELRGGKSNSVIAHIR